MVRYALFLMLLASPVFGQTVHGTIKPRDVLVHFVSPKELARICPRDSIACSLEGPVCQVYISTPVGLWGNPVSQYAGFDDHMKVAELAHELQHCVLGRWHPERR